VQRERSTLVGTPFLGKLGRRVASPLLPSTTTAPAGPVGSKGITCEGLPTGRTDLIRDGVLAGCLTTGTSPAPAARSALAEQARRHRPPRRGGAGPTQRLSLRRRRRPPVR
jgi:PmbA protein